MIRPTSDRPVPYHSQWESADLVPEFIAGRSAVTDPLWRESGANTAEEYAFWAPRMCGVACLRMALAHWGLPVPPSLPLLRELCEAGAYVREGDSVHGLIHRPFAAYAGTRYGIRAEAVADLPPDRIRAALAVGGLAMLSVHKTIRTLDPAPEAKGGHLVLAVAADEEHVMINNPSGFPGHSQQHAPVPWSALPRFYAARGILLEAPASA
ncbi:C39 family peptidase [Streptomyces vinaceus]|uniref:C39 family peptidase n=1 Tax=Streptomyces vinaceus TaxID=1960 RepID=UPI0036B89A7A